MNRVVGTIQLNSSEIIKIIRACGKSGVTRLSCGDLQVNFEPKKSPWTEIPAGLPLVDQKIPSGQQMELFQKEQLQTAHKQLVDDNISSMETELDQMQILNPHEYEDLLMREELEDAEEHRGTERSI